MHGEYTDKYKIAPGFKKGVGERGQGVEGGSTGKQAISGSHGKRT